MGTWSNPPCGEVTGCDFPLDWDPWVNASLALSRRDGDASLRTFEMTLPALSYACWSDRPLVLQQATRIGA